MKTTFVSTYALANNLRSSVPRMQSELAKAGVEMATSRHADVGLTLGYSTARTLSFRHDFTQAESFIATNGLLSSQLQRTQITMDGIADTANKTLAVFVSVSDPYVASEEFQASAKAALSGLISLGNTAADGQYLFSGINTGAAPFNDYDAGGPKAAVDGAFATFFGFSQSDPAVANITASDMQTFLDGDFAALFDDPSWGTTWSNASDTNITSRISPHEELTTSVNGNTQALRNLAMAYTMVAELGTTELGPETIQVVVDKARELIGGALPQLTDMQSAIGFTQQRVTAATERMTAEKDLISKGIQSLENVDPAEAKVRFDTLTTQIEMSYALTTKIMNLSILKYA
ncbi:flagellar hook-associated protein 3 FlgL [Rhodopseudomonas julia]|uniref:Flagellin n=1 Tax=Rhodopseudomonas julia TaxID=200617 RepID=A0ABU0C6X2_9BRAD|nr:flagellar hook-associated family protein [Rhodopseudomonas julia]MDQ0326283.1 flagellar hook-associated protein 3 FlgL [Rhodopseudomonas julia]